MKKIVNTVTARVDMFTEKYPIITVALVMAALFSFIITVNIVRY